MSTKTNYTRSSSPSGKRRDRIRRQGAAEEKRRADAMWDGSSDSPVTPAPVAIGSRPRLNSRARTLTPSTQSVIQPQVAQPQVAQPQVLLNSKEEMAKLLDLYKNVKRVPNQSEPVVQAKQTNSVKTPSKADMDKLLNLYKDVKPIVRTEANADFKGVISQSLFMRGGFDVETLLNIDNLRPSSQTGGSPLVDKYLSTHYRAGVKIIENDINTLIRALGEQGITIAKLDLERLKKLFDTYKNSENEFLKTLQVLEEAKAAMSLYKEMGVPQEDKDEYNATIGMISLNEKTDYRPLKTLVERANRYLDKIRKSTIKITDVKAALQKLARGDASDLTKLKTQINLGSRIVS
jgi:hypothetical protein